MEDDNWFELRLGLPCGGSSSKPEANNVSSAPKEKERHGNKLTEGNSNISDVSFKRGSEIFIGQQKNGLISRQHENFWTDLTNCPGPVPPEGSNHVNGNVSQYQELWVSSNKTANTKEEKSGLNKRKFPFDGIDFKQNNDNLVDYVDSSGENEGTAESQAENSAAVLVSHCRDSDNNKYAGISKFIDKRNLPEPSRIASEGQKRQHVSGEVSNLDHRKLAHGISVQTHHESVINLPNSVPAKLPMPFTKDERPLIQTMNTSKLQLAFGFSDLHPPTREKDCSIVFGSQPQHPSSFVGKGEASFNSMEAISRNPRAPSVKSTDLAKDRGKNVEGAGGTQNEDSKEGNNPSTKLPTDEIALEISEGSSIRPGIAPTMKFGGNGSYPDLPWVSTTGPGPNGRTISGVTYKYAKNQIKIVCACHGSHMSPEEFIQHANASTTDCLPEG